MEENPWDHWLRTNILIEPTLAFDDELSRQSWRRNQDAQCDYYQRRYAETRKRAAKSDAPWWEEFVSRSEITWDWLNNIEHPLDAHGSLGVELDE